MTTYRVIENKIADKEKELADLRLQLIAEQAKKPEHRLAESLHSLLCHHNHIDGCAWGYETSGGVVDWTGQAHGPYLRKALKVMDVCAAKHIDPDNAIEMFTLIQNS